MAGPRAAGCPQKNGVVSNKGPQPPDTSLSLGNLCTTSDGRKLKAPKKWAATHGMQVDDEGEG